MMKVELLGTSYNINIRLDKSSVKLENSITLTGTKTVKIMNRSNQLVGFENKLGQLCMEVMF